MLAGLLPHTSSERGNEKIVCKSISTNFAHLSKIDRHLRFFPNFLHFFVTGDNSPIILFRGKVWGGQVEFSAISRKKALFYTQNGHNITKLEVSF